MVRLAQTERRGVRMYRVAPSDTDLEPHGSQAVGFVVDGVIGTVTPSLERTLPSIPLLCRFE